MNTTSPALADARWVAVSTRDLRAEGAFLYGVRTTGVYCRPTCHSRLPRRENVSYYASPEEAERAGFRPCKRCDPRAAQPEAPHAVAVARARERIEHAETPPTLAELAAEAGLSPFHFQRVFKRLTGLSPKQYGIAQRERRLRAALQAEGQPRPASLTAALFDAGYGSASRAYDEAPAALGMTPGAYRTGAAGEVVRYGTTTCALGRLLVATTERGICAIELDDDETALVARLARRFPNALLERVGSDRGANGVPGANGVGGPQADADDRTFRATLSAVAVLVDAPDSAPPAELPLDVRGTAFQRRVWEALRRIPAGSTVTYATLAAQLGRPRAARAVAQACGANALAVAIPCHRVVGAGGGLGGYRWGIERKRALLTREAQDQN